MEYGKKNGKREHVKNRAKQTEHDHEATDEPDIPSSRRLDELLIDAVCGKPDSRNIRQEVIEQNLARQQRKERQKQRGNGHAHHVSKIGAGRREHILKCVGKSLSPFTNSHPDYVEV